MTNSTFPYEITENPIEDINRSDRFIDEMDDVYEHVTLRNKPNLNKVERFFNRWKQYPEVWNWYYIALTKNNRDIEANKLAKKTIEVFPDYIYGKCGYVRELISEGEIDEAEKLLGGATPDLLRWYPEREAFWYKDVLTYYVVFIELELEKDNVNLAESYLDQIEKIVPEGVEEKTISHYRMQIVGKRLDFFKYSKDKYDLRKPEYIPLEKPDGYGLKPFFHNEIKELFEKTKILEKELIDSILALPRDTAISDLEQMLYRLLFEYTEDDYERNEYYKMSYVLWFLYEFKALESAPLVSELLKIDGEDSEFWFNDFYTENTWFLFYLFLENNPQPFLDILYEPNLYSRSKSVLLDSMEQIAWHYPERKEEIIGWLENLLEFYKNNIDNEHIFDSEFVGYVEYTAMNLQAKSLLPLLKFFHDQKVMDEFMCGDYDEVEKGMDEDPVGGKDELPDIYTLAEKEAEFILKWESGEYDDDLEDSPYLKNQPNELSPRNTNNPTGLPVTAEKKVGRNDPCPCGSGKKYKKCCGG